jgi:CTP synthase
VVGLMTEWMRGNELERARQGGDLGGTMRLGAYPGGAASRGSGSPRSTAAPTEISERHRHRYEVNTAYRDRLEAARACVFRHVARRAAAGDHRIPDHPWFIGVQFHPELKSRPFAPHPLFLPSGRGDRSGFRVRFRSCVRLLQQADGIGLRLAGQIRTVRRYG